MTAPYKKGKIKWVLFSNLVSLSGFFDNLKILLSHASGRFYFNQVAEDKTPSKKGGGDLHFYLDFKTSVGQVFKQGACSKLVDYGVNGAGIHTKFDVFGLSAKHGKLLFLQTLVIQSGVEIGLSSTCTFSIRSMR